MRRRTPIYSSLHPYSPVFRALVGLAVIFVVGSVGYKILEGWTLFEGFYMTLITVTTIGFKEVRDLTFYGQLFTIVIIVTGIGMVGYALVTTTAMLIEGEVNKILTRRRSLKAISKLKEHFIVCGFGRMGSYICEELHLRNIPFVVVEHRPEIQEKILQAGYLLSPGDATEEDVLQDAGIESAKGLVSVLDSDASNVYVVLSARELNPRLEIIARAGEEQAHKKLKRAGASRVISPYKIGGARMVMGILKPAVMSFLELAMDYREYDIELEEILISPISNYNGKKLIETDLRKELNLIIIAVKKSGGLMEFNPGPNTIIYAGDTLIAMGPRKSIKIFEKAAEMNGDD